MEDDKPEETFLAKYERWREIGVLRIDRLQKMGKSK